MRSLGARTQENEAAIRRQNETVNRLEEELAALRALKAEADLAGLEGS